ncbi:hypothetical protein [Natrinema pallidum]|uniref:Helix-turn-helix domain-containing protein n=1 Tax=Natrinema pallidum TaxID=69527 RepID=A0A4P9TF87_9EURY|nr:hypothetical protein [Natrinema pallidum]QCW03339.1 hypothetical protein FGF80_08865 [Natrinema pallidum]
MRMSTAATLALAVLLATTTLGAVAATPSGQSHPTDERSPPAPSPHVSALESPTATSAAVTPPSLERPDTRQIINVRITESGNAEWTVESRFRLTNDTDAQTFDEYADAVVSGHRDASYDPRLFMQYVGIVSEATGREMSVENEGWDDPRIEERDESDQDSDGTVDRIGVISYSFTWTNFATVDGDRIRVGDSFQAADRNVIQTLGAGQRLVVEPPPNYGFVDAPTGTEDGALVWDGPHEFGPDGLQMTILAGAGQGPLLFSGGGWLLAAVLGLVIVVGGAVYLLTQRTLDVPISADRLSSLGILARLGEDTGDDRESPTADRAGGSEAVASAAADPATNGPEPGTHLEFEESVEDEIDPELLSDEERVLRLLKQNGGRMKQGTIVTETGWSNAKVSQLLSKMADDDEIEKLRIGRENLITLPGVDPTEID